MIRRAPRPTSKFYVLNKQISEDYRLSWAARGLLVYLLGKPDNWHISTAHLVHQTAQANKKTGRDGVYSLLQELLNAGYVNREQQRTGGKFGSIQYVVCESAENTQNQHDEPHRDLPETVGPDAANPPLPSTDLVTINKNTTNPLPPTEGGEDLTSDEQKYMQLVIIPLSQAKKDPVGYLLKIKARLKKNGLTDRDRGQLVAATKHQVVDPGLVQALREIRVTRERIAEI